MAKKNGAGEATGTSLEAKKPVGGRREGAGRPKKLLDPAVAEELGEAMPSNRELARHFGVDHQTIEARLHDQPEFAGALQRGQARAILRLSKTGLEQAAGCWVCAACNRVLREKDPTPEDGDNVKPCPDHGPEYFGVYSGGSKDGKQVPWRKWRHGNPVSMIWQSKQHLGHRDRSFIEEEYQRQMDKIPTGKLLELLPAALQRMGIALPADALAALGALQKERQPKEE